MSLPPPLDGTISITGVAEIGNAEWRKRGELTRSCLLAGWSKRLVGRLLLPYRGVAAPA